MSKPTTKNTKKHTRQLIPKAFMNTTDVHPSPSKDLKPQHDPTRTKLSWLSAGAISKMIRSAYSVLKEQKCRIVSNKDAVII